MTERSDLLDTAQAGPAAIRGGALRVAGYGAGVALSIGSAALLFRHLGVDDGGRYVTVLSLVAIVGGLTEAGLTAIGIREMAVRDAPSRRALVRNLLGIRIAFTLAGVGIAVAFAAGVGYSSTLILGTALAGAGLLLQNLQITLAVSLMSGLRLGWVTLADLLRQVVAVALIAALVLAGASLLPFLAVSIPAGLVVLVVTVALVRGEVPVMPAFHWHEARNLLRETIPYAAATAIGAIYFRVAIVLVSVIASASQTGYFGASFRIVEVLIVVPQLLVSAAFPIFSRAARDDHARLAYAVGRMFQACAIVGVWIALCLALAAPVAIDVVAGPSFAPAAEVLRIQGVAVAAAFVGAVASYALLSLHLYREILLVNLAALLTSAGATAVLSAVDGARGAAIATTAAELLLVTSAVVVLARRHPGLRPPPRALPRLAVAAAAGGAVALIPGLPDLAAAAVASVVYFAVLYGLGAIPQEALDELRRRRAALPG